MESSVVLSSDFADSLILAFCAVSGWGCGQRGRCPSRCGGKTPHDGFPLSHGANLHIEGKTHIERFSGVYPFFVCESAFHPDK